MQYYPQKNFARILTIESEGQTIECALNRQGPLEIVFNFLLIDDDEQDMIVPSVTMSWPYMEVVDAVFDGSQRSENALKEKALAAWVKITEQLD